MTARLWPNRITVRGLLDGSSRPVLIPDRTLSVAGLFNGTAITQRYSNTIRGLNTWYYLAAVYNATARTLDIYVNGVLDNGTLNGTVPASQFQYQSQREYRQTRWRITHFNGIIDDVRI